MHDADGRGVELAELAHHRVHREDIVSGRVEDRGNGFNTKDRSEP
jgi:hypothetical protein